MGCILSDWWHTLQAGLESPHPEATHTPSCLVLPPLSQEVTKKKKAKKGKKGGGGDGAGADAVHTHTKPCPSFFRFFEAADQGGALAHLERMMAPEIEEVEEEHEEDEQVGQVEELRVADSKVQGRGYSRLQGGGI